MAKLVWVNRKRRKSIKLPSAEELRALLSPSEPQAEFLAHFDQRTAKYVGFVGGVGSGKSHLGAHYALECAARNPDVRGFIAANTYPQLWQSTLTALYKVAKAYGVPIHPERPESAAKKKVLYLWRRVEVLCRSAERYSEWDGTEVGWFWLDEAKTMPGGAWGAINERLRDVRCDYLSGWLSTTPDGYNWVADLVEDPEVRLVNSHTSQNKNLPAGYVESLMRKLSPEMVQQQLAGQFINVQQGECYPHFDRVENGGQFARGDGEKLIGIDFNVDPGMHAYLCEFRGQSVYVLDEIFIKGGDTPTLAKEIERRYGTDIALCPDAAGGQRHTTGTSDHAILKERGFKLKNKAANPPIKNRINSVNGRILNAMGERNLFVDSSCKLLRNDLERCTWEIMRKEGYRGPLTHPGAAVGYAVHLKFPFQSGAFGVNLGKLL